ncbi:unnamed protein product [Phyllotreta striolata]|uniref:Copper transport protein ATOX1 n=1 Tax=Phyllotreta striolata TaxID=444603 RepID=A0A9N9XTG8_PHYSR|nr:unnamed protein product [Phyllotreta striolata]
MSKVFEFKVKMTCDGCSGAVKRVLDKHLGKGVEQFEVNLEDQTVRVTSTMSADELLETIRKTGKETEMVSVS